MSSTLENAPCKEYLPDLYRFAFLMTGSGDAAAEVLRRTVERATRRGIGDLRDPLRAKRWLFAEARQHCGGPLPAGPLPMVPTENVPDPASMRTADGHGSGTGSQSPVPAEAGKTLNGFTTDGSQVGELAGAFSALPERERSALILFYLYLFSPADLAETLELRADTLGPILTHGRALLTRELQKAPLESSEVSGAGVINDQPLPVG